MKHLLILLALGLGLSSVASVGTTAHVSTPSIEKPVVQLDIIHPFTEPFVIVDYCNHAEQIFASVSVTPSIGTYVCSHEGYTFPDRQFAELPHLPVMKQRFRYSYPVNYSAYVDWHAIWCEKMRLRELRQSKAILA